MKHLVPENNEHGTDTGTASAVGSQIHQRRQ